jgi:DNA polymerase (family 10)
LFKELKIHSVADLETAIRKKRLQGIPGIKTKTVENLMSGIALLKRGKERMPLARAIDVGEGFLSRLRHPVGVKKISLAGSLRRHKETVRDIDILVVSSHPEAVMYAFVKGEGVARILAEGQTKSSIRTSDDVQVDCRVIADESFGAALLYFTGSKEFNIKMRQLAIKKGWKINEYGVFAGNTLLAGKREEDIFRLLGMSFIPAELREDRGEIELALRKKLPRLLNIEDIRGDVHVHSSWSDGEASIEEMARAAGERGYAYVAVTDHSEGLKVANGLSPGELKKKKKEIDALNKRLRGVRILFGTEVDIHSDGSLDYPDSVLKEFDLVIAAIHTGFKQSKEQLTRRIIAACRNKYVHAIAHPSGRLWGAREAYELDYEEVLSVARETHTSLEINSYPLRLDLNDLHARQAREKGVKIIINTDAHTVDQLGQMQLGVYVARRAWLSPADVLNTLPLDDFLAQLRK